MKHWQHYSQMLQVTGLNWQASKASETLSGVYKFELVQYMCIHTYVYMYGCTCGIIESMPCIRNVGGLRPQPLFIRASRFNLSNHWEWHGL